VKKDTTTSAFALKRRDLLALDEHGDDGDGRSLFTCPLDLVAERGLERAKRNLLALGLGFLFPAARFDIRGGWLGLEFLRLEVFGVKRLDRGCETFRGLSRDRRHRRGDG
jgi:hypothetical protein